MSRIADTLPLRVGKVATAIANARAARRGAAPDENILDRLPSDELRELIEDAFAAVEIPPIPRTDRRLCAADADALRLDVGADSLLIMAMCPHGRSSAALSVKGAGAHSYGPTEGADALWDAVCADPSIVIPDLLSPPHSELSP